MSNEPRDCPTPGACSALAKIERLEAALLQIAGPIRPDRYGTALHERMRQIARQALASENEHYRT